MAVSSHSMQLLGLSHVFPSTPCPDSRRACKWRYVCCVSKNAAPTVSADETAGSSDSSGSSMAKQLRQLHLEFSTQRVSGKQEGGAAPSDTPSGTTPASRKARLGNVVMVDRWRPGQGSELVTDRNVGSVEARRVEKPSQVLPLVLSRLKGCNETEAGVALAMDGWETPLSARSLVTILNSLERWEKALPFFRWAESKEYDLNVFTYNVMVKLLRKGRQWDLAEGLAGEMIRKGVFPDNITYSTLISCASRCNRHEQALEWYEQMHDAGCVPDAVTYCSVLDMYAKAGKVKKALALYDELRGAGWKPDIVTYGTILNMFGKVGRYTDLERTYKELKKSGLKPTAVVYNILIRTLGDLGKTAEAAGVMDEMISSGLKPNAVTVSSMIDAYGKGGQFQDCLALFQRMQREGWGCDAVVHNSVLKHCVEYGTEEQAEKIFNDMQRSGMPPNAYSYKTMLHLYAKLGSKDKALKAFSRMTRSGFSRDVVTYTSLIQAHGQAKDFVKVAELFDEMISCGCEPDDMLWGSLFSILVLCEDDEQRDTVFGIFKKGNLELHDTLQKLISPEAQEKELHRELLLLTQRYQAGTYRRFINAMVDFCQVKDIEGRAADLLMLSVNLGVFADIQSRAPTVWRLHLRHLSLGASQCAVEWWMSTLSQVLEEKQELPKVVMIETGSGRGRWVDTEQKKKDAVISYLTARNSPFTEKSTMSEDGREMLHFLLASGDAVQTWLRSGEWSRPLSRQPV